VPDRDENAHCGVIARCTRLDVPDPRARDPGGIAQHLVERVVPDDTDVAAMLRLGHQLVDEYGFRAKLVASVHQRHRARDVREVERLLDGRIAAADDDHVLRLVEEAVARRARRHALAHECLLRREPEIARGCPGRNDERVAGVFAVVADEADWLLRELRRVDLVEDHRRLEALGVLLEAGHEVRPLHAVGVRGPVVDVGGRHQLPALREAGDEHRFEVGARRVYCGGVAGGSGAEDQKAGVLRRHAVLAFAKGSSLTTARVSLRCRRARASMPLGLPGVGGNHRWRQSPPPQPLLGPLKCSRSPPFRGCIIRHVKWVRQIHDFE
jgi:hypothetical protein